LSCRPAGQPAYIFLFKKTLVVNRFLNWLSAESLQQGAFHHGHAGSTEPPAFPR
jgi:hypothetical protein